MGAPRVNREHYNTSEAAERLGVSRNTLLRWFREGRVGEPARDFRGWRQFDDADLERIGRELDASFVKPVVATLEPSRLIVTPRLEFLRQVPVFSSLTDSDLAAMDAVAEFRGYKRGAILFTEGQSILGLHVLLKGRVKLTKQSSEGREQILEIVEPVSTFAEPALFDRTECYATLGRASVVSSVLTIPKAPLSRLMDARPGLSRAFLGAFAERMKALMRKVEEATFLTVDQRLAGYVLREARNGAIEGLNIAEVAAIIGAVRESVHRALKRWSEVDIVVIRRGALLIVDEARLARYA